jgi:diaminohydroxyphosphoribosylaminopyrimidine deaminase/5-amino-6-(5-phosphoribosylamino)uracil reductase
MTMPFDGDMLARLMEALYLRQVSSLLVEGGGQILRSFAAQGLWDQALIIDGSVETGSGGIPAPRIDGRLTELHQLGKDRLLLFDNPAAHR